MQHWYVYHSDRKMEYSYASIGRSAFYLKTNKANRATLNKNDVIWVIEGDLNKPTNFKLADCFQYLQLEEPPFDDKHLDFKMRILGKSLLNNQISLDNQYDWFASLHEKYLTKQKFFFPLSNLIVAGLKEVSGIKF